MKRVVRTFVVSGLALAVVSCNPTENPQHKSAKGPEASEVLSPIPLDTFSAGINFFNSSLPSYVASVSGLAAPESFGRWSIGKLVLLDFSGSLPEDFELEMVLGGYNKNVGANLQVIVGAELKILKIETDLMRMKSYVIRFSNPDKSNSIGLIVPYPTSPQSTGDAANDPRMLGIALQSLYIRPISK